MPVSTTEKHLQVGYGNVRLLTKASSEPQVNKVEDAVPKIAALPYKQLAVQDSSKTMFGQSRLAVEGGMGVLRSHGTNSYE